MDCSVFIFRRVQNVDHQFFQETDYILLLKVYRKHFVIQLIGQLQIIYQRFHVSRIFQYDLPITPVLFFTFFVSFIENLSIPFDRGKRRLQIMGDIGDPFLPHFFCLLPQLISGPDLRIQYVQTLIQILEYAVFLNREIIAGSDFPNSTYQPFYCLCGKKAIENP